MHPSFESLPLFASDHEIAVAIVGQKNAAKWVKERFPAIEKLPGFPKIDVLHGGRAVPLVARFYEHYLGLAKGFPQALDGEEDPAAWHREKPNSKVAPHQTVDCKRPSRT